MANKFKNIAASGLVKTGYGTLYGLFASASSSGVVQLVDGINDNDDAADKATGTLTSSGAMVPGAHATSELVSSGACVPAVYGSSTLTSDATNVADGETVTINTTVYRFKDTMAQAFDVKIGADAATSLDNLKAAINATGTPGVEYFAGTTAHPQFIATTNADTTQVIVSRTIGNAAATAVINAYVTQETSTHLSWTGATITNGVAAVTSDAATVTIGSTVYTAVTGLAESYGLTAVPNQVLWETSEAVFLDNLKVAVNAGAGAGTKYGTGTTAHADVVAFTNTNTVQTFTARTIGTAANTIATTTTLANYAFADTTLGGGTGNSNPGVATTAATFTIDGRVYTVVQELTETAGATAVVDQVLYGGSEAIMLDNIKVAIDAGETAGTNYSTGTVAHTTVTATTNSNTTQVFEARTAGTAGNSITTTETMANHAFGAATLEGGLAGQPEIIEEFPIVAGSNYPFTTGGGLAFSTGLYFRLISGTGEVTIEYR